MRHASPDASVPPSFYVGSNKSTTKKGKMFQVAKRSAAAHAKDSILSSILIGGAFALIKGALVQEARENVTDDAGKLIVYHKGDKIYSAKTAHLEELDLERVQDMMDITSYWDDVGDSRVDRVRSQLVKLTEGLNILRLIEYESLVRPIFSGPSDSFRVMSHCDGIFKLVVATVDVKWLEAERFMEIMADMEVEISNAADNVRVSITRRYM